jgi:hypothetical protein
MKSRLEYNGIIVSIITNGSRVKFDLSSMCSFIFRRGNPQAYNGGAESLFPVCKKQYDTERDLWNDVEAVCKKENLAVPLDCDKALEHC